MRSLWFSMSEDPNQNGDITQLVALARAGHPTASAELFEQAYAKLRQLAAAAFSQQPSGHTLQATALVHEAWMKLSRNNFACGNRAHFFAIAAKAMRQVLIDHARSVQSAKRGGSARPVTLDDHGTADSDTGVEVLMLDECLQQLATLHPRHAEVVELRVFAGLTIEDAAKCIGVSSSTIESDWRIARAWLRSRLTPS